MTGCAVARSPCADLLQAAQRIAGGRGYLGSPASMRRWPLASGQRRVLVSHAASCEHWSAAESALSGDGEEMSEWLLAG